MAQLDANKVQLNCQATLVTDLVNTAVERARVIAPSREIRMAIASTLPAVFVDPAWIQKVLANLLGNALKYSAPETPVFISADRQGDTVAISVADRGAGIDPMEQSMIFDKFYRGQGQRARISGTGMGLAISRAIVNAHGGTINVTSQLNHGSVFTFTVPIAAQPSSLETPAGTQAAVS
jgi:two-component system sensor histidine kinase KdpD